MDEFCIESIYPEDLEDAYVSATSTGGRFYRIDAKPIYA
jgi:hypothetical protein